jgi:hypothetical protein
MFLFIIRHPIVKIETIEGPLSLSNQFGGLVPGRNLVLVCWERETVRHCMDNQLVAVWANCLGASVTASVASATTTAATAATTPATTTAAATAAATATVFFGHGC